MIAGLKPYPAMKDSGVEWLGAVPEHWELRRTKTILKQRSQKGFPDEPLLAATQTKGVVRKEQYENRTVLALKDLHLLKLVCFGDFVISLRSFQGGIEYAHERGIISPAYTILYPNNPDIHDYLAYLFKSKPYVENLTLYVTGIRQGQNIDYVKLSRSELPLPPLPEQTAIVRYLDYMDKRIRKYIRAKQKLIKLLEEQKQAIIHRAVTRGLDPDVPLKPSGVEWLGDVPQHWEVTRLKGSVANIVIYTNKCETDEIYIALEHVESWTGKIRETKSDVSFDSQVKRFRSQDVLFGKLRPYLAKVTRPDRNGVCVGEFLVLRPCGNELLPGYLEQLIRSKPIIDAINASTFGAKMPRADWYFIGNMEQPIPPLPEQIAIIEYLKKATADIDTTIARGHREIELLREYRTRLIADVVTGKLDVREAAANLPDESESIDRSGVFSDNAEETETVLDEVPEEVEETLV